MKAPRTAFLFPGQGAQEVGMGAELYEHSRVARKIFDEADEALDMPLRELIFQGPKEQLARTENAQPAILCVSIAYLTAIEDLLGTKAVVLPRFMAGHSLGEYTALVAAGAMPLHTGLNLVRQRGQLMQEASDRTSSTMAAIIGLELSDIEKLCRETGAQLANVNSAQQSVIAGSAEAVRAAQELAKQRGARKTIKLDVSGAFHTELMRPAQAGLEEYIAKIEFQPLSIPIVANTTALPINTPSQITSELKEQLCRCVWWQQSIQYMSANGVDQFVEIGPSNVLTGLTRRIQPTAKAISLRHLDDLTELEVC